MDCKKKSQGEDCCWCGQRAWGDGREEICSGDEENQVAMEAECYCWVTMGNETTIIASPSPHASYGQLISGGRPPVRGDFLVPDVSSNRERPAMETLECQLQRLEKTPYRAMLPAPMAIDFPVYLAPLRSPWSKQSHHFHEWTSLGQTKPSRAALGANS